MATVAPASTSKLTSSRIISGDEPLWTCLESLLARMTVEGMSESREAIGARLSRNHALPT